MCHFPDATREAPAFLTLRDLSPAERRFLVERNLYASARVEVSDRPREKNFSVVDEKAPGIWRWSICCPDGLVRDEGWESSLAEARRVAREAQELWFPPIHPNVS